MWFLKQKGLGIDVGEDAVRAVLLVKGKEGFIPEKIQTFHYDIRKYGKDALLETLKKVKKSFSFSNVVFSIPDDEISLLKTKISGNVSEKEVVSKIEENIAVDLKDITYSYEKLDDSLIITIIPKDILSRYSLLTKNAGFKNAKYVPRSKAISKTVLGTEDETSILVNIGIKSAEISLLKGQTVYYSVTGKSGAREIIELMEKILGFYRRSEKDSQELINIYFSGFNVLRVKSDVEWGRVLNVILEEINIWKNCFDTRKTIPPFKKEDSFVYGAAVGLALTAFHHKI